MSATFDITTPFGKPIPGCHNVQVTAESAQAAWDRVRLDVRQMCKGKPKVRELTRTGYINRSVRA